MTSTVTSDAAREGIQVVGETNFATVIHGAAIKTRTTRDAERLKQKLQHHPAVQNVWYAGTRHLVQPLQHNASMLDPSTSSDVARDRQSTAAGTATTGTTVATGLQRVPKIQQSIRTWMAPLICIVDTGINYQNELFGSCTGINKPKGNCQVVTGYNFVGDQYNGKLKGPQPVRGGEPVDCMGHGSMVASVAATGNGVAPGALLGSYRVFGCQGSATDDIIIEAIDRAVRDGCDIINLSLASGSGYSDSSVYSQVMRNALKKGVLVVKAAGNSGAEGPFTADVYTAVGSIAAASVGDDVTARALDDKMISSQFSSYGPAPDLELHPHVSAPGAFVRVRTQDGYSTRVSGTSFSAPYISGCLALWLQQQQQAASVAGLELDPKTVDQQAAMSGLVATAQPVPDSDRAGFVEPVAKVGAGVLQVDALMDNKLSLSPMMIQLPSALNATYTANVTIKWLGTPHPAGSVTYEAAHLPAAAITVDNGWYGTDAAISKVYAAAIVKVSPERVVVQTTARRPVVKVQVTFKLPAVLTSRALLYSGSIRFTPVPVSPRSVLADADAPRVPAVGVPYQGFSQDWSKQPVLATPLRHIDSRLADNLEESQNALCYAPGSKPTFANAIMDNEADVPAVCSGGITESRVDTLDVSLGTIKKSPECSLRVTLVPQVPVQRLYITVMNTQGQVLGALDPLDTSSGSALSNAGKIWSFCLRFDGSYWDRQGKLRWVRQGSVYRLRASLEGPL
eukprot:gene14225-14369_t